MRPYQGKDRRAYFICYAIYLDQGVCFEAEGRIDGFISHEPRGKNGFGYDPVFFVPTHNCSSAELTPDTKNSISHRGQALKGLLQALSA